MKTPIYISLIICFLYPRLSFSQIARFENLLTKPSVNCTDVTANSRLLIPGYYKNGNRDTVQGLMQYWEEKCGYTESLMRLKILLAIKADTFNENLYKNARITEYVLRYRQLRIWREKLLEKKFSYDGYAQDTLFEFFTQNLARKLSFRQDLTPTEQFFIEFYSHQNEKKQFDQLRENSMKGSILKREFDSTARVFAEKPKWHAALFGGIWMPGGQLKTLGSHPLIGYQLGLQKRKFLIDLTMEIRFLKSANPYLVKYKNTMYSSEDYTGFLIGMDLGYNILRHNRNDILLACGIAADGFDALSFTNQNGKKETAQSLYTFNLNPGIAWRLFDKNNNYIGLDLRYNILNFKNIDGTDLSGNAFSLRLKFGGLGDKVTNERLKLMERQDL